MFTLGDCIARINLNLNYPGMEYVDVYPYFDQALSELNTSLKIGLLPLSEKCYGIGDPNMVDLNTFLPTDWIILFIIPYVCYKVSMRDNSSGDMFNDEMTQGFIQLNNSYDIPNFVDLATVADKPAYLKDVNANMPNLNIPVSTRAIYESMKVGSAIHAVYGSTYDNGGWGL